MKLPYRLGDSFALPLGNGQFARSCIVQCEHRVVVVRVFLGEESWLDVRASDDALALYRWRPDERVDVAALPEPRPENRYWMHAPRVERLAAAALGAPHPRERNIRVREVRDENAAHVLAGLDDDCMVTLSACVSNQTLERVIAALYDHPGVAVRLAGDAAAHLPALSQTPIVRLSLAAPVEHLPHIESIRHLDLACAQPPSLVADAFPNLESLRVAARGVSIALRELRGLARLRTLDLSLVNVSDATEFAQLEQLRALRINRVTGIKTAQMLAPLHLRTLALEHVNELHSVAGIGEIAPLEQLTLLGLWQFDIRDVEWALQCEALVRAEIDIGGRRKNMELYRRANWAYPWPFAGTPVA